MNSAFALVKERCWKASCNPLSKLGFNTCVISDMNGVLCVFDGEKSMPVKTSMILRPDVWEQARNAEWGVLA